MRPMLAVLAMLCVACAGESQPDANTYPTTLFEGTFQGLDAYGRLNPYLALIYADENGRLHTHDLAGMSVILPTQLNPGDHFALVLTAPSEYALVAPAE